MISNTYAKFTEEQLLEDYLKIADCLTINQNLYLYLKISKNKLNKYKNLFMKWRKKHKNDLEQIKEKHTSEIKWLAKEKLEIACSIIKM